MENVGAHESGEDGDGNKDRLEAGALADRTGPLRGNQFTCGRRPGQKRVVHNPYFQTKVRCPVHAMNNKDIRS